MQDVRHQDQIVLRFDVALRDIRDDLETKITELRRRVTGEVERRRGVVGSRLVIAGTRITSEAIERMLAVGWDDQRILQEYPDLTAADLSLAGPSQVRAG